MPRRANDGKTPVPKAAYRPRTSATPSMKTLKPLEGEAAAGPAHATRTRSPKLLPGGAFPVPISTVDWLVSREAPAARHVTLRDLMARPEKDIELRKARQALPRDPFVRDSLPYLRAALARPRAELSTRYTGGLWLVAFLMDVGVDGTLPELRHASDVLFARFEKAFLDIARSDDADVDLPSFGLACRVLAQMGLAGDPRIVAGAEHCARKRVGGGLATVSPPLAQDLLLFASVPIAKRSSVLSHAISFCVERALGGELAALPEQLSFPHGAGSDLLELLYAFAVCGVPDRPEIRRAVARLAVRADHRARWLMDRTLDGRLPVTLERVGELSRWLTVRSLRVLQQYGGIQIVERSAAPDRGERR